MQNSQTHTERGREIERYVERHAHSFITKWKQEQATMKFRHNIEMHFSNNNNKYNGYKTNSLKSDTSAKQGQQQRQQQQS